MKAWVIGIHLQKALRGQVKDRNVIWLTHIETIVKGFIILLHSRPTLTLSMVSKTTSGRVFCGFVSSFGGFLDVGRLVGWLAGFFKGFFFQRMEENSFLENPLDLPSVCHGRRGRLSPAVPDLGPSPQEQPERWDKSLVPAPFSFLCLLFPICAPFPELQGSGFPQSCRTGSLAAAGAVPPAAAFLLGHVKISWCLPPLSVWFGRAHPCAGTIPPLHPHTLTLLEQAEALASPTNPLKCSGVKYIHANVQGAAL